VADEKLKDEEVDREVFKALVNVSRIAMYQEQIKRQKKIPFPPVEIDGENKYKVEKILNMRDVREKVKYLVRWKGYTVEKDT